MSTKDFYDDNGLVVSSRREDRAENSVLWTYELILIRRLLGNLDDELENKLINAIIKMEIRDGLFHQHPEYSFSNGPLEDRYMSHDQLTAITSFSYINGWNIHKDVWKEINKQGLMYDNYSPKDPERLLHPRDIIYYGMLAESKIAAIFSPILALTCIISCLSKRSDTSGKILTWVRTRTLKKSFIMNITKKICDALIKRKYGCWYRVFSIYFPYDEHPITKAAYKLYR